MPVDTLQAYETLRLQGGLDEKVAKAIVTACTSLLSPSFAEWRRRPIWSSTGWPPRPRSRSCEPSRKGERAETKAELIKWMVGLLVAQTVVLMGLFKLLL